jgi:peptidoglycan/xylan/chitin deacetylase (PgdA/CDA1 family)
MRERVCAVSVDLDGIDCYYRIHGLELPRLLRDPVALDAIPRFRELFEGRRIPATFFVVGAMAESEAGREALPALRAAGHELANHSYSHPYDLFRLGADAIADEVGRAHRAIAAAGGAAPRGFRAPGYGLSPALLDAVAAAGYSYDSSVLPSPTYYAAKAVVMGVLRLRGTPSRSALHDPRLALAPRHPYRPDPTAPWRRGQASVVELPIAVSRGLRIPVIGMPLTTAPAPLRRLLVAGLCREPVINLELHGLDLCDAAVDGIAPELRDRQPDLGVPLGHKRAVLGRTLDEIAAAGYRFVTLIELARLAQRGEL